MFLNSHLTAGFHPAFGLFGPSCGIGAEDVRADHAVVAEHAVLDVHLALVPRHVERDVAGVDERAVLERDPARRAVRGRGVDEVAVRGRELVLRLVPRRTLEPHAGVEALGLALRLVVGVREALVEDEAVELHVDALGLLGLLREVDREDAEAVALLVVVLVERLEHRPVRERLALREVLGVAADDRDRLVDQEPVLLHLAGVDALGEVDRVAVLRVLERLPEVLERSLLRALVLVLAGLERDVDVGGGSGERGHRRKRRQCGASVSFHVHVFPVVAWQNARLRGLYQKQPFPASEAVHRVEAILPTNRLHFQMERARTISEKRTFAALESLSVPMTIRIAQDSNWA